jgi:hypothetical protein
VPVTDTLPVHLSREELHAVETLDSFEATGPFDVEILNHGRDVHPHLKLSDSLAEVATIEEGNPYVAADESVRVRVSATPRSEPVSGTLKIETGYGAESGAVRVTVRQPTEEEMPVDEDLATPESDEADPPVEELSTPDQGLTSESLPVVVLALAALVVAAATATLIEDIVVIAGVVVVLVAVVVAGVLLLR